jgi:diguanylate cyclase (GGDEF)-like protein
MAKRQTILIAEDDQAVRRILQKTLARPEYEVLTASDGEEALRLFLKHRPALVVTDWMMPRIDGPDLCRAIRCDAEAGYTYVLLLTTKSERADVVRGLEAGADDYVTKPFDGDELLARIRAGLRIVELEQTLRERQCELEEANHQLAELAVTDPLTGLCNRRHFEDLLERDLAAAVFGQRPLSVALIDVDKFKSINDRFGHAAGDWALRHVARKLAAVPSAVAARIGGDEFALLFSGVELDEAERTCGDLAADLRSRPVDGPFGTIPVGISVGVAAVPPLLGKSAAELLAAADAAMYRAKALSRPRVNGAPGKPHCAPLEVCLLGG